MKRTVITSVSLSQKTLDQLRTESEKKDRSVSYLIREAITNYLKTIK